MSSQNSSNDEFENLDDMLSDAEGVSMETDMDNPFGDGVGADGFQADGIQTDGIQTDDSSMAGVESLQEVTDQTVPSGDETGFTENISPDGTADVTTEGQPIQYKKAHCWDMYSVLLFVAWLALLGGIAILYFECPPSEYGNPPYKESSTPVKSVEK